MKLVFATHNDGKVEEMRQILTGLPFDLVSADEAGCTEEILEDADSCEENALLKARTVAKKTGEWAFADDTGLFIDALDGNPGPHAARWAQEGEHVAKTLAALDGIADDQRGARFISVVALVSPNGEEHLFKGVVEGTITVAPQGVAHPKLPYDTLFLPKEAPKTFGEMNSMEKNALSHRGRAFRELRTFLRHLPAINS